MSHGMNFRELMRIPTRDVRSLVWEGDELIDWAAGGRRFRLDGSKVERAVNYAYHFDAACQSPSGDFSVLYERLGTKGLLLRRGKVVRELNRSFYHADVYEYPVVLAAIGGREVVIHCPEHYNQLEIDDAETGERLTWCAERKPCDFFHSRLFVDPSNNWLGSAGWVWHPCDGLHLFRLPEALSNPKSLDRSKRFPWPGSEINSAAFLDEQRLIVAASSETFLDDNERNDPALVQPSTVVVWDVPNGKILSQVPATEPVGAMLPVDARFAVGFYQQPKIFDLQTGAVVARRTDLPTGDQLSSIMHHIERQPHLALDFDRKRFAVAVGGELVVVEVTEGGNHESPSGQ